MTCWCLFATSDCGRDVSRYYGILIEHSLAATGSIDAGGAAAAVCAIAAGLVNRDFLNKEEGVSRRRGLQTGITHEEHFELRWVVFGRC